MFWKSSGNVPSPVSRKVSSISGSVEPVAVAMVPLRAIPTTIRPDCTATW